MGRIATRANYCRAGIYRSLNRHLENIYRIGVINLVSDDLAQTVTAFCTVTFMRSADQWNAGNYDEFEITGEREVSSRR